MRSIKVMIKNEFNLGKYNNENNLLLDNKEKNKSEKEKGFVTINNRRWEITKLELINLIESTKETIIKNKGLEDF